MFKETTVIPPQEKTAYYAELLFQVTEEAKAFQAMTEPKVSPDGLGSPVRRARKVQVGSRASLVSSESLVLLAFQ